MPKDDRFQIDWEALISNVRQRLIAFFEHAQSQPSALRNMIEHSLPVLQDEEAFLKQRQLFFPVLKAEYKREQERLEKLTEDTLHLDVVELMIQKWRDLLPVYATQIVVASCYMQSEMRFSYLLQAAFRSEHYRKFRQIIKAARVFSSELLQDFPEEQLKQIPRWQEHLESYLGPQYFLEQLPLWYQALSIHSELLSSSITLASGFETPLVYRAPKERGLSNGAIVKTGPKGNRHYYLLKYEPSFLGIISELLLPKVLEVILEDTILPKSCLAKSKDGGVFLLSQLLEDFRADAEHLQRQRKSIESFYDGIEYDACYLQGLIGSMLTANLDIHLWNTGTALCEQSGRKQRQHAMIDFGHGLIHRKAQRLTEDLEIQSFDRVAIGECYRPEDMIRIWQSNHYMIPSRLFLMPSFYSNLAIMIERVEKKRSEIDRIIDEVVKFIKDSIPNQGENSGRIKTSLPFLGQEASYDSLAQDIKQCITERLVMLKDLHVMVQLQRAIDDFDEHEVARLKKLHDIQEDKIFRWVDHIRNEGLKPSNPQEYRSVSSERSYQEVISLKAKDYLIINQDGEQASQIPPPSKRECCIS